MEEHYLQLRVVYNDLHLIELGARVRHGEWSAVSTAYADHTFLTETGHAILRWAKSPDEPLKIEAGGDTGAGWMVLQFYTIDSARHTRCAITLATGLQINEARPAETSRLAIELPTELGLVERFAQECIALGSDFKREAWLIGLPV